MFYNNLITDFAWASADVDGFLLRYLEDAAAAA